MIGVFDSGFGGLTILKEFLNKLPEYNYIYLGDNARAPYGNKSPEAIYGYTQEAVDFLFKKGCDLIIIACNTASADALGRIQKEYLPEKYPDKRVLGVIIPLAEAVAAAEKIKKIGLIGTRATVDSKTYESEIKKIKPELEIYSNACPLLVPLVEEGWIKKPETKSILKKYLRPLKEKNIDSLVLGCTHYPVLMKDIERMTGKRIKVLNSPEIVAEKLEKYLNKHPEIEKKLKKDKIYKFFTTDDTERFKKIGKTFLGKEINKAEKIKL